MSNELKDLISTTGDEAKDLIKSSLLELIKGAKDGTDDIVRETGIKIERWIKYRLKGDLDEDEFRLLLEARKRTVEQHLNTINIQTRAQFEKLSIGLINLVIDKALGAIF